MWPGFGWQKGFGQGLVKNGPFPLLPHKEFISGMATILLPGFGRLAKARKSKESKARTPRQSQRGPGCTGNRARMHRQSPARKSQARIPRQKAQPQQEASKAWQSHRGWPGSSGKRPLHNAEGQEAPAKPPRGGPRKHRQSRPGGQDTPAKAPRGAQDTPATGEGHPGKVPGFRVYTFVIATSVRVITCREKQLWRPSVSALPEPPDLCYQSLADRSDGFGPPGWVTSPQPDFRV